MSDDLGGLIKYSSTPNQDNISISKIMHTHTIETDTTNVILDQIDAADTSDYQQDFIPPASSPTLPPADLQASDQKPNANPSPQSEYLNNVEQALYNLPSSLLASLGNGKALDGLNKLIYAFNHPNANIDPQTSNALNQIIAQATTKIQNGLGLNSSWTPASPDSEGFDKQVAKDYNSAFENLVKSSNLSDNEVNSLIFYHYHPEDMPNDYPFSQDLANFENEAFSSTSEQDGLPSGTPKPLDSAQYDAKVSEFFDEAFTQHLANDSETQNLTNQEKSDLETLLQFPDANLPDKADLSPLLNQLEQEALNDTQQKYALPDGYRPATSFKDFSAVLLGNFQNQFAQNVQNDPTLTDSQKQQLLNTYGVYPSNLPPSLQAAFLNYQNQTAASIAVMLGLPPDWLSASETETPDQDAAVEQALSQADDNPEAAAAQGSSNNAGINAFAKIFGKLLNSQRMADVEFSGSNSASLNSGIVLNALNLAQDAVFSIQSRSAQFANISGVTTADNGWLNAGQFTALIAGCLDKLRESVYQMQSATAESAGKVNQMSLELTKSRQAVQDAQNAANAQMEQSQQQQPKSWSSVIINAAQATGSPFLEGMAHAFVDYVKTYMWVLDMVTGGLISTICQAAGMEDLAENPLEMAGVLTADQAKTMDLVVGIICMVAQIVAEALIAQPELMEMSIMDIVESVQDAVEVGIDVVKTTARAIADDPVAFLQDSISKLGTAIKTSALSIAADVERTASFIKQVGAEVIQTAVKAVQKLIKAIEDAVGAAEDTTEAIAKAARKAKEAADAVTTFNDAMTQIKDVADSIIQISGQMQASAQDAEKMASLTESLQTYSDLLQTISEKASKFEKATDVKFQEFQTFIQNLKSQTDSVIEAAQSGKIPDDFAEMTENLQSIANGVVKGANTMLPPSAFQSIVDSLKETLEQLKEIVTNPSEHVLELYKFSTTLKDAAAGIMQGMASLKQGQTEMQQAALKRLLGTLDAELTEIETEATIINKTSQMLLDQLTELVSWIGDINKQESDFFKKLPVHFISA